MSNILEFNFSKSEKVKPDYNKYMALKVKNSPLLAFIKHSIKIEVKETKNVSN